MIALLMRCPEFVRRETEKGFSLTFLDSRLWGNGAIKRKGGSSMASELEFVEYVCEQIGGAGSITYKKMFGEYGVYCDAKIIGLICDNQFFLKKTETGRTLLPGALEAPPYPGARPYFVIEALEDREVLSVLVKSTYDELPPPVPKRKKPR
jgi:TfoX/Sxy family transcriptional regulator of competence genes